MWVYIIGFLYWVQGKTEKNGSLAEDGTGSLNIDNLKTENQWT